MKRDIHPEYMECTVKCSCGNTFTTHSTKPELRIDICNVCHPFYSGTQKLIDTGGRVQRFADRFGDKATSAVAEREAAKKAERAAKAAEREAKRAEERAAKAAEKAERTAKYAAENKAAEKAQEAEDAEAKAAVAEEAAADEEAVADAAEVEEAVEAAEEAAEEQE